jgi:hypothetical protein
MARIAVVVLAGTESAADRGRVLNALETAAEFADTPGDEVEVVFDGAATRWIPELEDEAHDFHALFDSLREHVTICGFCASAFEVEDAVGSVQVARLTDHDEHPSVRDLYTDGYEMMTF